MNDDDMGGLFASSNDAQNDPTATPAPDLDMLKRMFREAASSTDVQRRNAREDRDFYDGPKQLDDASRAKARRMRVPETYCNKISSAVNATLGLLDGADNTPEAVARNENGEDAATIVTQVLRYQADKANLADVLRESSQYNIVEGICAAKIEIDDQDNCKLTTIAYEEFFYDPHSVRHDFKDATYLIHAYWSDLDAVKRKWPHVSDQISLAGFDGDGPEDQPSCKSYWIDSQRKRVMLVDNYYVDVKTGTWKRAIYCHSTVLEHGDSGYKDDGGKFICPIEGLAYDIMREGERKGMVRNLVPLQRKINGYEHALHKLAISNRVRVNPQAGIADPKQRDVARKEAQKSDGVMPEGYDIIQGDNRLSDMAQAVAQMKQEIDDAAPGRAQIAQAGANTSGRARQILQQSGLAELARAFGRFEDFEERICRQMWFRARQFMTDQTMIRVTDDAGAKQSLVLNYPIVHMVPQPVMAPVAGPDGTPMTDPTGQPVMRPQINPMTGQPVTQMVQQQVGTHNELAQMDMEITLKVVRASDTLRQESIDSMLEYSARLGISFLDPSFEFAIELLEIPDKTALLNKWREIRNNAEQSQQAGQQAQQQQQAVQQQAQQQSMGARAAKDMAAAHRDQALAEKHSVEVQGDQLDLAYKAALLRSGQNPGVVGPNS